MSSYSSAITLLATIGLTKTRTEEKKRTRYKLDGCNFDIDTWPDIPTYVEIEAESEAAIRNMCSFLELKFEDSFKGSAHDIFRHYGIEPSSNTYMVFNDK